MTITQRIDAITKIDDQHLGAVISAPRSVKIEITATCNYKCGFCVKSIRTDSGEMDRALFSRVIRELRSCGVEELGLFYIGESFTCKWLPDAIREAKSVGFPYIFLTTNGSAAPPARVRECMAAGLDSLKFSMNYATVEQFTEVARVNSTFWRRSIDNLKAAKQLRDAEGYSCRIYASSIAFDGEQGKRMAELVEEIRPHVDEHYWLPLYGMGGASKSIGWAPKPGNPGRLAALRDPLPCWAVFTEGHITHDGKLAACCFGSGIDGDLIMADLTEVGFMEGWNSLRYRALRRAHLTRDVSKTACAECAAA